MTLPPIPAIAAVLFCAALFVLLFQYLFPRPAPWRLVGAAVVAGAVCTYVLSVILRHLVGTGPASFDDLTTIPAAFTFAILRVGLPEELTKAVAALLALAPFWRRVSPAQAFQAALYSAVGFAIVENQGYATAFGQHALLIAFGRGFLATLTHTLLAMIFGLFLMRFVAHGWRHWHLLVSAIWWRRARTRCTTPACCRSCRSSEGDARGRRRQLSVPIIADARAGHDRSASPWCWSPDCGRCAGRSAAPRATTSSSPRRATRRWCVAGT